MLAGNQNFTGDLIGIESTDPSCYSNYIVLGGTAPGNLDVVGFTLTWTGTSLLPVGGSPVTISYMANGSENSQPGGWQTYIASQLGAAMRANATIATNWGVGAVTTTNVVAVENEVAFDVPFPVTNVSQPMTISNACTDAHGGNGNVTLTINSVLTSTTGAMGGAVSTILDTNPSFTITRPWVVVARRRATASVVSASRGRTVLVPTPGILLFRSIQGLLRPVPPRAP